MNNLNFTFKLNAKVSVIIEPDQYDADLVQCFREGYFSIMENNHKTVLCHSFLISYLEEFAIALKQALHNNRQLDSYFIQNVGYYWNESINGHDEEHPFNEIYDILHAYTIWESHITTWIYNDNEGNIILEITPYYPHTHDPEYSYQDFLQWMKNYKSLIKYIIPQETAQEWIHQLATILTELEI